MTDQEKEIIDLTAEIWNKYIQLPVQHPCDRDEFCKALHICQHLVMIRETRENNRDLFYIESENKINIDITKEELSEAWNNGETITKEIILKKS